jgi:predicted O-methyltransferase YrrM
MRESIRGRAKRVLMIGIPADGAQISPDAVLALDGMLIVMEADAARAAEMRRRLSSDGLSERATVIGGDPKRMLYKLAGPFDVIVCGAAYLSLRPALEKLLATDGVFIANGET